MIGRRYLAINKFRLDNKSIRLIAEQNRRAKDAKVFRNLIGWLMSKVNFARYPLASNHHSERVERRCHTEFIVLPDRTDPKISQCVANERSVAFNHK